MLKKYLTEDEQKILLKTLKDHSGEGEVARRDGATIRLLICTGLRIGECLRTSVGDAAAALKNGYLFVPKECRKGRTDEKRDHEVLVTKPVREALLCLLRLREGAGMDDALIVSRKKNGRDWTALSVRGFELRARYWAMRAGLPDGVSPHWFRHTRAMNIMRRTTSPDPLGIVKAALGHASIRSSEVYARTDKEQVAAALREVDGNPRLRLAGLRREYEGRMAV
jgi:integrase